MYLATGSTKAITPEDLLANESFVSYHDSGGLIGYYSGFTYDSAMGDTQVVGKLPGCKYVGGGFQGSYEFSAPVTINPYPVGGLKKRGYYDESGSTFSFLSTDPSDWKAGTYNTSLQLGSDSGNTAPKEVQVTLTGKTNNMIDIIELTGVSWTTGLYYGAIDITSSAPFIVIKMSNNKSLLKEEGDKATTLYYCYTSYSTTRTKSVEFYGPRHSLLFFKNNRGELVLLN